MEIVEVLKALADDTRMRILKLLYQETLCACDLEEILEISQSNASRHLMKLKNAKLITGDKQAQWVFYRVNLKMLEKYAFVKKLLEQGLEKNHRCQKDAARLKKHRDQGRIREE